MQPKTLRVRARGAALVENFETMGVSPRRFVGREWTWVDGFAALKPTADAVEVPFRAEYMLAVKQGDLWAADAVTAAACGVPFDPNFGASPEATPSNGADQ